MSEIWLIYRPTIRPLEINEFYVFLKKGRQHNWKIQGMFGGKMIYPTRKYRLWGNLFSSSKVCLCKLILAIIVNMDFEL